MVGLAAAGVERVLMMPAGSGLTETLLRTLRGHRELDRPRLELLDLQLAGTAADTAAAVAAMRAEGVDAIAVLGGDGTSRVAARHCGETPLCPLSTGTNNAFPSIREATVAGIAVGLLAAGRVDPSLALRRAKLLRVSAGESEDCALVDAALTAEPWVGARALWRPAEISDVVVAFGEPGGVGLSAIAGLVDPVARTDPHGLYLRLVPPKEAALVVRVPLAPGLVLPVGVAETRRIPLGRAVVLEAAAGSLALDGERELELPAATRVEISVDGEGPMIVDVDRVMLHASEAGLLRTEPPRE
jgi:predicted polyphosphate/ATP-dependent NAD kinase